MTSFLDQRGDGKFDLVPFKYDNRSEKDDPTLSRETIWINMIKTTRNARPIHYESSLYVW